MDKKTMELRVRQWMPIFEAQAQSGLSKYKWCEENGIRRWEFFTRQREIRKYLLNKNKTYQDDGPSAEALPAFVEIPVSVPAEDPQGKASSSVSSNDRIAITCGRIKISIPDRIEPATLERLIRSLSYVQ